MKLENKTVLITGASSGIGHELARQLAAKGCRLLLIARRENLLRALIRELPGSDHEHLAFPCDVSKHKSVKEVCEYILDRNICIDVLILNTGISKGFSAEEMDVENIEYEFAVNFFSHIYFMKYLLPPMLERNNGLVAVTGSLAAYRGMPRAASYSASKAALAHFIESLRVDLWGRGVKFCLISPGFVRTAMTEKHDFYMPFLISVEKAARIIIKGLEKEKPEIHFPYRLSIAAKLIKFMPYNLYAKVIHNARKIKRRD